MGGWREGEILDIQWQGRQRKYFYYVMKLDMVNKY